MSLRDKFIETKVCDLRSAGNEDADRTAFKSLFEREWEVFVIKRDPASGNYRSLTLCCDEAPLDPAYENKAAAVSCR